MKYVLDNVLRDRIVPYRRIFYDWGCRTAPYSTNPHKPGLSDCSMEIQGLARQGRRWLRFVIAEELQKDETYFPNIHMLIFPPDELQPPF